MFLCNLPSRRLILVFQFCVTSGDSGQTGQTLSSSDDTGCDSNCGCSHNSPVQPTQSKVIFIVFSWIFDFIQPCKEFLAEFSNALMRSSAPNQRSKTAQTLASMSDADIIGLSHAPEIKHPVAAQVVSPGEVYC